MSQTLSPSSALRQDRGAGGQTPFGPQEVETMSQTLSPSCSLLWLGARCACVDGLACQRLSLPQRDAAEHDRPSSWPGRGMFGRGIGRPYPPANSCLTPSR